MEDTLAFKWRMDAGRPALDADQTNPLSRSLTRLATTGKPFSRLSLSFLNEGNGLLRWFGVFVEGQRTMFFPGFSEAFDGIDSHRGQQPHANRPFDFDHLSLEKDRQSWHLTARGSVDHLGSPQTLALGDDRVLWFGLSFSSLEVFRPLKDETLVEFSVPTGDTSRRRSVVTDARKDAAFPILSLPEGELSAQEGSYFHISVIAGPAGFETYRGPEHAFPIGSPYLASPFPAALNNLPIRIHRLPLSLNTDLQITLTRLAGKLIVPVAFTGSNSPTATITDND